MDNGQQNRLLADAMRKYLDWDAKSIVMKESYLGFKTDWTTEKNASEAMEFAEDTDLFIFQDMMSFNDVFDVRDYCGHRNTIITGTGTTMRNATNVLLNMQQEGWAVVPPISDDTIATKLFPAPFENVIVPIDEILEATKDIKRNDIVTVAHAPTKTAIKGTDIVESILKPLEEEGVIKYLRIQNMPWIEALRAKATAHITIDSVGKEWPTEEKYPAAYGAGNALEGITMGHLVIGRVSPWCYALHPDLPIETIWGKEEKLKETILETVKLMKKESLAKIIRNEQLEWAKRHFSAEIQIMKWQRYIEWVMNR